MFEEKATTADFACLYADNRINYAPSDFSRKQQPGRDFTERS